MRPWPYGQAVKTPPFHGGNPGSIPGRVTSYRTVGISTSNGFLMSRNITIRRAGDPTGEGGMGEAKRPPSEADVVMNRRKMILEDQKPAEKWPTLRLAGSPLRG